MTKLTATNLEADFRFAVNPHKCRLKLNFGVWLTLGLFWVLEQFGRECFQLQIQFVFFFFFFFFFFRVVTSPPPSTHPSPTLPFLFSINGGGGIVGHSRNLWIHQVSTHCFNYCHFLSVLTFCNLLKFAEFVFFFTLISQYVTVW